MNAVLEILRASGPKWTGFLDLCHVTNVPTDGLSITLDRMERRGLVERIELYYGADPLAPHVPPNPYQGFQFGYRLKAPSTPPAKTETT